MKKAINRTRFHTYFDDKNPVASALFALDKFIYDERILYSELRAKNQYFVTFKEEYMEYSVFLQNTTQMLRRHLDKELTGIALKEINEFALSLSEFVNDFDISRPRGSFRARSSSRTTMKRLGSLTQKIESFSANWTHSTSLILRFDSLLANYTYENLKRMRKVQKLAKKSIESHLAGVTTDEQDLNNLNILLSLVAEDYKNVTAMHAMENSKLPVEHSEIFLELQNVLSELEVMAIINKEVF